MHFYNLLEMRDQQNGKRSGAILIAVMGLIMLMALVVTLILNAQTTEFKRISLHYDRERMTLSAQSLLEVSLATLGEIYWMDGKLSYPGQGWNNPLQFYSPRFSEETTARVRIVDETGKLALSATTSEEILQALFEKIGMSASEASTLTDSLLDWIDPDEDRRLSGAERDFYEHQPIPYLPADGPLKNYEQLRYINAFSELFFEKDGKHKPAFEKFERCVSLLNTGPVNLNTADPLLLELFCDHIGIDYNATLTLLNGPDGVRGTADDGHLEPWKPENKNNVWEKQVGNIMSIARIDIEIKRADAIYTLISWVSILDSKPQSNPSDEATEKDKPNTSKIDKSKTSKTKNQNQFPENFFTLLGQSENDRSLMSAWSPNLEEESKDKKPEEI
jgi:type II secretory pathway component PulK